ncbi:hypothetical protein GPX89_07565 [Nocardia sp. ET3-3]|uniref:DUF6630 domain-containing protein n=1 Tax=Nocardia terrae TaxID=2675851 RepID=A0A7K1URZ1_9NOCA|nr:hypothetical protein [Nocardia terrae]MVU77104.1 hypothetical protein [Nocardia terrae]
MAVQDPVDSDDAVWRQPWDVFDAGNSDWKSRCRGLISIAALVAPDEPSLAEYLRWVPALSLRAQFDEVDVRDLLQDEDLELTVLDLGAIELDDIEPYQFGFETLKGLLSALLSLGLLMCADWKADPREIRDGLERLRSYPEGMSWEWFEAAAQDYEVAMETGDRFFELLGKHSRAAGAVLVGINTEADSMALGFIPVERADAEVLRTSNDIEPIPKIG